MLSNISDEERTLVLLELTRRLILYSSPETYIKKLQAEKENRSRENVYIPHPGQSQSSMNQRNTQRLDKEQLKEVDKETSSTPQMSPQRPPQKPSQPQQMQQPQQQKRDVLKVPEPKLPPQFSHLKPDNKNINLDLGKLNPLLRDSAVNVIECHGPNEKITVKGSMGEKPTNIQLSQEEIDGIINTFSEKTGIPIEPGTNHMVLGKYAMNALKPEGGGNKRFTIKKMPPQKARNSPAPNPAQNKSPSSLMPSK